jgi:predicted dehydrogenase
MVTSATATLTAGGVDRELTGELRFIDGPTASMRCGFLSTSRPVDLHLRVTGSEGEILAFNPVAPHLFGHLRVKVGDKRRSEWADRTPSYTYQLRAFVDAVRDGVPFPTTASDAVRTMEIIDALLLAAGTTPPNPTPVPTREPAP